ncbi:MAG: shikimate kinase [Chitinophagaceae bacterium]
MPGSGKSFWGNLLAQELGYTFVDTDSNIEIFEKQSISQIFEQHGEAHFRALEAAYLRKLPQNINLLVATGGGTPCFHDNMSFMLSKGLVIWLNVPVNTLVNRLMFEKAKRPILAQKTHEELVTALKEILAVRTPFYQQAQVSVNATEISIPHLKQIIEQHA